MYARKPDDNDRKIIRRLAHEIGEEAILELLGYEAEDTSLSHDEWKQWQAAQRGLDLLQEPDPEEELRKLDRGNRDQRRLAARIRRSVDREMARHSNRTPLRPPEDATPEEKREYLRQRVTNLS